METIRTVVDLGRIQSESGVLGDILEMGVYEGKSFIPLYWTLSEGEKAYAVDCFGEKLVTSGVGAREEKFIENVSLATKDRGARMLLTKCLTNDVDRGDFNKCRVVSVDAGHEYKEAMHDLNLSGEILAPGGFIMLDDVFNYCWPGVVSALCKWLTENPDMGVPLIDHGIVFISRKGNDFEMIQEYARTREVLKSVENFFCEKVVVIGNYR